jgi:hypothetical protein
MSEEDNHVHESQGEIKVVSIMVLHMNSPQNQIFQLVQNTLENKILELFFLCNTRISEFYLQQIILPVRHYEMKI